MFDSLKILWHQGRQYIPDVTSVAVPGIFRGRPVIAEIPADVEKLADICPTGAITQHPFTIDLGKCTFCGECALRCPDKIRFTNDYKISSNVRENLIIG